ncbi:methyl-accepting chemotaxis, putative [Babesia ovata]|uniref:Methyl-accepting chemotaxis, putative n=1 Tax=Babesia ovata TaxID=189622 RepID=A0A2H6KIN1_9APIC|nr:methyl-accepting chemotaxis, putative [Babesia ovata]GBE62852.1 methyl-accepting chemotaxis, putative [Babesia ovata]
MVTGAEDCRDVQCDAPLPEARVADGVLEGRLTVLNACVPLICEVEEEGEQVVWRPWRAGEEAFQVAAEPGEGRRCAAAEGAEDVHDGSAWARTGGQPGNVGEAHGRLARQAGRRSVTAGARDTGAICRHVMRQEAHKAVLEERLERRLDAALGMVVTLLVTYLVVCLVALLVTHLVGTQHGVAPPR